MKQEQNRKWKLAGLVYFTAVFLAVPMPALAYIDPSVTSYLIQAIAGVVVAIGAFFAIYWRRAKKKVQDKLGIDENAKKETEADVQIFDEKDKNQKA